MAGRLRKDGPRQEGRRAEVYDAWAWVVRLIRKWLKAGVAEVGQVTPGQVGTPQGAVISLLANIYLHHVFDLWAQHWRKRHAQGDVIMVRYADDIVVGSEHQAGACPCEGDAKAGAAVPGGHAEASGGLCPDPQVKPKGMRSTRGRCGSSSSDAMRRRTGGTRSRQTGDVQLPWLHPHQRAEPAGSLPTQAAVSQRRGARKVAGGQGSAASKDARDNRRAGGVAAAGCDGLQRLSCCRDQLGGALGLPFQHHRPLAARAELAWSEGDGDVEADDRAAKSMDSETAHHASVA